MLGASVESELYGSLRGVGGARGPGQRPKIGNAWGSEMRVPECFRKGCSVVGAPLGVEVRMVENGAPLEMVHGASLVESLLLLVEIGGGSGGCSSDWHKDRSSRRHVSHCGPTIGAWDHCGLLLLWWWPTTLPHKVLLVRWLKKLVGWCSTVRVMRCWFTG